MKSNIDLHIHTNKSDGTLTPKEVVDRAVQNGATTIAISDHDTVDAHTRELYDYAQTQNVRVIPAVEISTKTEKCGIHVLGYNIDVDNKVFRDKLYTLRNARHIYLHDVARKLGELGYEVNTEKLDKIASITKKHIAQDIVNTFKNQEKLIKDFGYIPREGEFIETVMNEGCPAYVSKQTVTPKEAAEIIRKAGGKVILAHPVCYTYEDNLTDKEIISIIDDMNADGIEANYIYANRKDEKISNIEKWREIAKGKNLIVTVGSDFHGPEKGKPDIGLINENIEFTEEYLESIIENITK